MSNPVYFPLALTRGNNVVHTFIQGSSVKFVVDVFDDRSFFEQPDGCKFLRSFDILETFPSVTKFMTILIVVSEDKCDKKHYVNVDGKTRLLMIAEMSDLVDKSNDNYYYPVDIEFSHYDDGRTYPIGGCKNNVIKRLDFTVPIEHVCQYITARRNKNIHNYLIDSKF